MPGRLTRFLNLEKRRNAPDASAHGVVTKARFEGAGPPELGVELDYGGQPFVRCPACEADNGRGAERCFNCQRALQTDDVRAWNAGYWTKRQHDEAAAVPQRHHPVPAPLTEENRRLAEALAREVGEHERTRLYGWRGNGYDDPTPIGLRILRSIEDDSTRLFVTLGFVGAFFGSGAIAYMSPPHSTWRTAALGLGAIILALFTPNIRRRRWWW